MMTVHQSEISMIRQKNMVVMIESIAVFVACLFVTAFLPQLLFKYFYANQQLTAEPPIFSYIQVGTFVVGMGYFIYAAVGNALRAMQVRKLQKMTPSSDPAEKPSVKRKALKK